MIIFETSFSENDVFRVYITWIRYHLKLINQKAINLKLINSITVHLEPTNLKSTNLESTITKNDQKL